MRIFIDFGHPAHVHYFRNTIEILQGKGHKFSCVARDKEVLQQLLNNYHIPYKSRGKGAKSLFVKVLYMFYAEYIILKEVLKFKPDLFLSFSSTYAAHVSRIVKKPHIVMDDTEHAKFELMSYPPFSDVILNPSCFYKKFSKKQLFFNSYMELFYLNSKYFTPDFTILESYGLKRNSKFFILRFVSWKASHDIGQKGLSLDSKINLVKELEAFGQVLISSESTLPVELQLYQINIKPEHLHHFLAFASLYIGEGATTASECAALGIPAIYVNTLSAGTLEEQEAYGLLHIFPNFNGVIEKAIEIINLPSVSKVYLERRKQMLNDKIDGTAFLVWFIQNYPESEKTIRENPDYQYNFK
jgi:predicted glycosyltransferase